MDRAKAARIGVTACLALLGADLAYKTVAGISYLQRGECILYRTLPRPLFLFLEYFVELFLIVVAGVFAAALLERAFGRMGRFLPRSQGAAFLWAAALPLCACGVVPLLGGLRGKLPLRVLVTFVVAEPILSPATIVLSFTVLGPAYGALRIATAFLLAVGAGWVVEGAGGKEELPPAGSSPACHDGCAPPSPDPFLRTWGVVRTILPSFLVAGTLGVLLEMARPLGPSFQSSLRGWPGLLLAVVVGIPLYLCNGAEILLLRPLSHQGGVPMGTAVAFSLASTSVCITSLALLPRFLGRRATAILLLYLLVAILLLGAAINLLLPGRSPLS